MSSRTKRAQPGAFGGCNRFVRERRQRAAKSRALNIPPVLPPPTHVKTVVVTSSDYTPRKPALGIFARLGRRLGF